MSEEKDQHPCFDCAREGRSGAYYKVIGHPIIVCDKDKHESIVIIDLKQGLDSLYENCPFNKGE